MTLGQRTTRPLSNPSFNRTTAFLGLLCVGLLAACATFLVKEQMLRLKITLAEQQVRIFDNMRDFALESEPAKSAEYLEYVVGYYPSGTHHKPGSRLDRIVERARTSATKDIINDLRIKTGEDLGEDPAAWISKYAAETE